MNSPLPTSHYNDIINLSHPRIVGRTPMSMMNRAAQFAPFAALNGYEESIEKGEADHRRNFRH